MSTPHVPAAARMYGGIDRFRIVAAFLVVAIHTYPLLSVGVLPDFLFTRVLARIAVPFFLATTGFFLLAPYVDDRRASVRPVLRFVRKTSVVYLVAIALYLPLNLYAGQLGVIDSVGSLARMIFIDGTFYHLWYLPAAILGTVLVWGLLRVVGLKGTAAVACVLYGIGLLGDSYFGLAAQIPVLDSFYSWVFTWSGYTRNGLFYAPVFLLAGVFAAKRIRQPGAGRPCEGQHCGRRSFSAKHVPQRAAAAGRNALLGLVLSLLLLAAEGSVLFATGIQRHDSMYAMLPVCTFMLMVWLSTFVLPSEKALRDISLLIYLVHPWAIVAVRGFAKLSGAGALLVDNSIIHYLAVCALSAAISIGLVGVRNLWPRRRKKPEATDVGLPLTQARG